ncbi:MAG: hypothetical protein Kow00108_15330 [Calditrichia bacterium]
MKKIFENLKNVFSNTITKTDELTRLGKLKWDYHNLEDEYREKMVLLGERVYERIVTEGKKTVTITAIKEELENIKQIEDKLKKIEAEVEKINKGLNLDSF